MLVKDEEQLSSIVIKFEGEQNLNSLGRGMEIELFCKGNRGGDYIQWTNALMEEKDEVERVLLLDEFSEIKKILFYGQAYDVDKFLIQCVHPYIEYGEVEK